LISPARPWPVYYQHFSHHPAAKTDLGNGYSFREVAGDIGESRDSEIEERLSTECLGAEEAMISVVIS
jgi:hypothetical protein